MARFRGQNHVSIERDPARSARTAALPGVGLEGQERISQARVLVIGAGGLGSPVLQYLAASGVGVLGIVDFDHVDVSNLQRQVIHGSASIGQLKTASAAAAVGALNPEVTAVEHAVRLGRDNALEIFRQYEIVVDASDNFPTRYLANDSAALLGLPYVWGSVSQFDGQVTVFWEGAPGGGSLDYRDLHPVSPDPSQVLSCAEGGVLGSLCGTIGSMMATEVIKLIVGLGQPLLGRVQNLDARSGTWSEFELRRAPDRVPVTELMDYDDFCGVSGAFEPRQITADELRQFVLAGATVIDVREPDERAAGRIAGDKSVPLADLLADPDRAGSGPVVLYCASGVRSLVAARALSERGVDAVSLRGGFADWQVA